MPTSPMIAVLQQLRSASLAKCGVELTDGQLLKCFVEQRDTGAIASLVWRHGPMVWSVCRRVLRNDHDAEDAFQATFLVLIRRSAYVVPREMVGNWLYGVAYQTARKARGTIGKRQAREKHLKNAPEPMIEGDREEFGDFQELLDQELSRLPDRYRIAIILCDLEGKSGRVAANQLRVPAATLATRLRRARAMLAKRLTRRGIAIPGAALAGLLTGEAVAMSMPTAVATNTIRIVRMFAAGQSVAASAMASNVAALMDGVIKSMLLAKLKITVVALGAVVAIAAIAGLAGLHRATQAAEPQQTPKTEKPAVPRAVKPKAEGAPIEILENAQIFHAIWTPDGKSVAAVCESYEPIPGRENDPNILNRLYANSTIKIWDASTGKLVSSMKEDKKRYIRSLAFSPDGKTMATVLWSGFEASCQLKLMDTGSWQTKRSLDEATFNLRLALSPDGKMMAYCGATDVGSFIKFYDVNNDKDVKKWDIVGSVGDLQFAPDGKVLAVQFGNKLTLFDCETGQPTHDLGDRNSRLRHMAFSPDRKTIACSDLSGTVQIWDVHSGELLRTLNSENSFVDPIAFSPDGSRLAGGCGKNDNGKLAVEVRMWDPRSGELKGVVTDEILNVTSLTFSPNGKTLAVCQSGLHWDGSATGKIKIISVESIIAGKK
jgi:RNA polymerase sigma factor (sigma-70 family)